MKSSQYEKMINGNVKSLLIALAIPTIISMLITSVYNMVDTYFVSQINKSASAAVSVVFSLQSLIQAVGFTLGMGSGALISRLRGKKNDDKANEIASSTVTLGFILGLIILVFGLIFTKPIMYLLGATKTNAQYASEYAFYIFLATPFMVVCFILNNVLRSEGHSSLAMIGLLVGGIMNMGLDPLFMFALNMGISGAGLSTMISQIFSFIILISLFIFHKADTRLSFKYLSKDVKDYLLVIKNGSPTLFRQGFSSLSNIILNFLAHPYGDACIAALGITSKVYHFVRSIVIGIGQGYQPVLGYNYGAKKNERIKEAFFFTLFMQTAVCLVFTALVLIFPYYIVRIFISDVDVIEIGKKACRLLFISFPVLGFSTIVNQSLQVTGFSKSASFLASLRQGILFIPLVYLLSFLFKDFGLCLTQPLSDFLTAIISIPFLFMFFRILKNNVDKPIENN